MLRRAVESLLPGEKLSPEAAELVYRGLYAWRDFYQADAHTISRMSKIERRRTIAFPGSPPSIVDNYRPVSEIYVTNTDALSRHFPEINLKAPRVQRVERVARGLKWATATILTAAVAVFGLSRVEVATPASLPNCPKKLKAGLAVVSEKQYIDLGHQIQVATKDYEASDYLSRNGPGGFGEDEFRLVIQDSLILGFDNDHYFLTNGCTSGNMKLVRVPERTWLRLENTISKID